MTEEPYSSYRSGPKLISKYRLGTMDQMMRVATDRASDEKLIFWSDGIVAEYKLGELDRLSSRLADAFCAIGLRPGDGIAVQMPNRMETAVTYRAAILAGLILTPIVHIYGAAETSFILRQSKARAFVCLDRWRGREYAKNIIHSPNAPDLVNVIVVGEAPRGTIRWQTLLDDTHQCAERPTLKPADTALLLYTSGTTAEPKGVIHTHASLLGEIDQRQAKAVPKGSRVLSPWPAGHIGGFSAILTPQLLGLSAVLMDRWQPEAGVRLIERYNINTMSGVPVVLTELLDAAVGAKVDLSGMSDFLTGAANVSPSLVERAEAAGLCVYRAYGSSEHPTVTSGDPSMSFHDRAFTDGKVGAGTEVRLLDDEGCDIVGNGQGEIATRGAELFKGYQDSSLNAETFLPGGWFKTGDIGRFEGNNLIITDRKKDIIIRGGEKISSKEVEDILASHPAVAEIAVIATPHERLGETVCAVVRWKEGEVGTIEDLISHFALSGSARQKAPERLESVIEFPRTAAGKIKKAELRALLGR